MEIARQVDGQLTVELIKSVCVSGRGVGDGVSTIDHALMALL